MSIRQPSAASHLRLLPPVPDAAPPDGKASDSALVEAMRRLDPRAAHPFHDRVRPGVERAIARLVGHHEAEHDDLVQTSLIELMKSMVTFRGDCSLDSWVAKLTARVVFAFLRKRKAERRYVGSTALDEIAEAPSRSPEAMATSRALIARLRQHLQALSEEKAWTYWLHDVCGYELGEIAEITHSSVSAAQTRLVRGRRELHERIESDPELGKMLETVAQGAARNLSP